MKRILKLVGIIVPLLLILFVVGVFFWVRQMKIDSYPLPGGGASLSGLNAEVMIDQDDKGIPTIRAQNVLDAYRAQGWINARDRLFQMDLIRRRSAGRLSEIFGKKALAYDRLHRWLENEVIARKAAKIMHGKAREEIQAYTDGVNSFIKNGPRPFEMQVIGYEPEPWTRADSLLVVMAMHEDLEFFCQLMAERALTMIQDHRGSEVRKFLSSFTGFYDMPLEDDPTTSLIPLPPSAEVINIRTETREIEPVLTASIQAPVVGSNGWVMNGGRTKSGYPILAGDPHLSLNLPNIWYRTRIILPDVHLSGVSLPGMPGLIIGNNGHIAWTMTNGYSDPLDLVELNKNEKIDEFQETILVKGSDPVTFRFEKSKYGPVFKEVNGKKYAIQWVVRDPGVLSKNTVTAINLARNNKELRQAFSEWYGPLQNFIYATSDGDIGWQLIGKTPKRVGFDGQVAVLRDEKHYWDGYYEINEMPHGLNPESGMIVSGNQRLIPVKDSKLEKLPFLNNASSNSRAWRIKEILQSKKNWTAKEMFDVQMDNFSYEINFYKKIFLKAYVDAESFSLMNEEEAGWLDVIGKTVKQWNGRVNSLSPAYPFLRRFRSMLIAYLLEPIAGLDSFDDPLLEGWRFRPVFKWYFLSAPMNSLLMNQPIHLLSQKFKSYNHAILKAAVETAKILSPVKENFYQLNWGKSNQVDIFHPFAKILPDFIAKYFRVPKVPFDGDHWTPRVGVAWRGFFHSASLRLVSDFKDLKTQSFVNFPGGQSGHFQSPHFLDQYEDWLHAIPTPLEPGKTVVTDRLVPAG